MVTRATSHRFRLTLGLKIGLGFAMGAAVTVGVGLVGIFGIATISATMDKTSVANQAFVAMNDVHQTFSDFLAAKTDRTADATSAKIGTVIEAIHRIDTGGANFKTAQSALNDLKIEIAAMLKSETDIRSALALNDASSAEITAAIAAIVNRANGQSVEAATLEQATMARLTLIDTVLQQIDQLHTSALKSSGFIQKYAATGDDSALQSLVVSDGALDQILAAIEAAPLDPVIAKNAIQVAKSLKIALTDAGALNGLYQTAHAAGASDADRAAFAEATDALVTRFDGVVTRTEGMRLATGNVRKETLDGMLQASKKRSAAKDMAVLGQTTADARSDLLFAMKDYLAKAGRGDDAGVEAQITRLADLAARTDTSGATNGLADAILRYRTSFAAARDVLHRQDDIRKRAETAANTAVRTISDIAAAILSETNETTSFQRMLALATLIFGCLVTFVFASLTARSIRTPITALTRIMARLAEGDTSVTAPETGRSDEIGEMSRTVSVFRDAAIEKRRLEADAGSEAAQRAERQLRIDAMIAEFRADIERLLAGVSEHARKMEGAARRLNDASGQSQRQVLSASGATSEATENVSTVAASAEELAASIDEISQRVKKTVEIVGLASDQAQLSNERITGLAQSATRIGDVVKLIRSIAEQTNLLALNATIEAARAGDAGRGFAVVAAEVKQLADQTAKATQDIAAQVDGIQLATRSAVDSIGEITRSMQAVNTYTTSIALAVAEQGSATSEISRNAQGASQGTQIVAQSMDTLVRTASETTDAATDVNVVAREVIDANRTLTKTIDSFLETVAAA